ncbi:nitroreductase family protein [Kribbella sp. NPDC000426]|uniref:Acg family FMN-binding oxidoreductase n=1 Tax=Kribbella sp. NPDC000426 TaxID=3154255 RepID=UPI0033232E07
MNAALTDDEIGILLTAAVQAPSIHNTQPWRFEVHGPVVDVLLDEERTLPVEDASGRAAHIGAGAAAFNVQVAAAMLGHESRLAIHPDPARPEVTARIFLAARSTPVPGLSRLYGEVSRRHTYRGPLLEHRIPSQLQRRLSDAARTEGARLRWLDPADRSELGTLLKQTDVLEMHDEDRLHERHSWVGGDRSSDGVPGNALGPSPVRDALVRDLSAGYDSAHRSQAVFETDPTIVVLATPEEDADAWVRAGAALQRVLLTATSYGLVASFLDQLLEHAPARYQVRELIGGEQWPQMVIRIGYPAQSVPHPSRRNWRDSFDQWF